jgi:hypothetical protein
MEDIMSEHKTAQTLAEPGMPTSDPEVIGVDLAAEPEPVEATDAMREGESAPLGRPLFDRLLYGLDADLENMRRVDLLRLAEGVLVVFNRGASKDDLVALLEAARWQVERRDAVTTILDSDAPREVKIHSILEIFRPAGMPAVLLRG